VVAFQAGVDTQAEVARLEESYGFTAQYVFTEALQGFAATFDANVRDMMRCEPSVAAVQHNSVFETETVSISLGMRNTSASAGPLPCSGPDDRVLARR
jgi:hypothetical protein